MSDDQNADTWQESVPCSEPFQHSPAEPTGVQASLHYRDGTLLAELSCDESAGNIVIGRGDAASVSVMDPYVHRVHAYLTWAPDRHTHVIAHAGGENATYVNRRKVHEPVELYSGSRIRIGKTELIYRLR